MSKYIVTVKLPKNPNHDPKNKVIGPCPLFPNRTCTDVTGEHHSFVVQVPEGTDMDWILTEAKERFGHVTRIEQVK